FDESPIHRMVPQGVRVGQTCEYVDYEQFQRTPFYNEFLAPRRIHHMATLLARLPETGPKEGSLGVLGLHRDPAQDAFSAEDLEILDLLYNPVEGALHTLLLAGSERQHLEQAFDSMQVGLLVLDWKLERVYSNPALAAILNEQELTEEELAAIQEVSRQTRDRYVSRADEEPEKGAPLEIRRGGRGLQLRATVLPEGLMSARPHLLCVFDEQGILRPNSSRVQSAFGLTDREAEVVGHCLLGLTNGQIANEMKISAETVKHHLKSVFEKTGVSRRSQLAALLP
ncbi:MAG: helix-turn-helix transcriptional regulator, partial [Vicinamibacteria bacterium]